jgi:dCMP deaminase
MPQDPFLYCRDKVEMPEKINRPNRDQYFMGIAIAVRERADCKGQKVGAVIVIEDRIISTGYNGTPEKMVNCSEGGCVRCENRGKQYPSGSAYDLCICVHAEQNAILSSARFGISVDGAILYTTTQPCFGCLKEMLQAKISQVYYIHKWSSQRNPEQENRTEDLWKSLSTVLLNLKWMIPGKLGH